MKNVPSADENRRLPNQIEKASRLPTGVAKESPSEKKRGTMVQGAHSGDLATLRPAATPTDEAWPRPD